MKKLNCVFWLLTFYHFGFSQTLFKGTIKDSSTNLSIPFVSVGIFGTLQGVLSDANGNFELPIQHITDRDTIKISALGYNNLFVYGNEIRAKPKKVFYLKSTMYNLSEVSVKPQNLGYKILGSAKYNKDVCTAFTGINTNWRGEQAAIQVNNKEGTTLYIERFNFYIIKNEYSDSLQFRLMLYEMDAKGFPGETFLKRPILFKTNLRQGEVEVDLKDYYITTNRAFFISLECLEAKMEASKFCFAGSIKVPSFVKTSPFAKWVGVKGGGGDFNVKVSYIK